MTEPRRSAADPQVEPFFDPATSTVTYVVHAGDGTPCVIIDPVLDYDPKSGRTRTASADAVIAFVRGRALRVEWILETHAHADHLTAAPYLKRQLGGRIGIGARITEVQQAFGEVFNAGEDFRRDGSQFDRLWADGETFAVGALAFRVLAVPGHTPACVAYQVGDAVFAGDTLFMPDVGTARTDFPGGDAATLFRSIRRLLELPPETRIFVCHDYPPAGRTATFETTVAAERAGNIHVRDGVTEQEFVTMRTQRDATLAMPVLLLPAVQVNMRAGELPPAEANGVAYLKIPIDAL